MMPPILPSSSSLMSYLKHGFPAPPIVSAFESTIGFVRDSLASYAKSALPFVSDAHRSVESFALDIKEEDEGRIGGIMGILIELDSLYQAMTLNHVARRASTAQGVALLNLYSKGFSRSASVAAFPSMRSPQHENQMAKLVDEYKLKIRREEVPGHLPICWGLLTAALGLTLDRAQFLHLFLHARGLLSAAVRLNDIGPYGAQQMLLHAVRPLVVAEAARCRSRCTGILNNSEGVDEVTDGPANTWPLGEILAARHDLQHSRIFNS